MKCWYCGNVAKEIWQTTWDAPRDRWPMCERCAQHVRTGLALRAEKRTRKADEMDAAFGISTSGECGQWVEPPLNDDLRHPGDCWTDAEELPPSPADQDAREYAKIVAAVKERLGCPDLGAPILMRRPDDDSNY